METSMSAGRANRSARRRRLALGALIVLAVAAGAIALFVRAQLDVGPPVAGVTEVAVRDDTFVPAAIEAAAGSTVTWRWEGQNEHNVVGEGFASPLQTEGEFAQTFIDPGVYPYQCTVHPFMRGEVHITEESA